MVRVEGVKTCRRPHTCGGNAPAEAMGCCLWLQLRPLQAPLLQQEMRLPGQSDRFPWKQRGSLTPGEAGLSRGSLRQLEAAGVLRLAVAEAVSKRWDQTRRSAFRKVPAKRTEGSHHTQAG